MNAEAQVAPCEPTIIGRTDDFSLARALAEQEVAAAALDAERRDESVHDDAALARALIDQRSRLLKKQRRDRDRRGWFGRLLPTRWLQPDYVSDDKKMLRRRFDERGWETVNVRGDGACQFRALAHQLWNDEEHHGAVRRDVVRRLRESPPAFHDAHVYTSGRGLVPTPDLEAYLRVMARPDAWGDQTTLQAAADCYAVRIHLVTTHSTNYHVVLQPEASPHASSSAANIRLGFYAEVHYVAAKC